MESRDLKHFIEGLEQLPSLPPVAVKLIQAVSVEDCNIREISRLIESDQALCSRILRIANSAAFGLPRQVSSVHRATTLLGLDLIRSVALSIVVVDTFKIEKKQAFDLKDFWRHSGASAIASELLAHRFAYPQPQEAFIAGLLHDVGKLVFSSWDAARYEEVVQEAQNTHQSLLEVEEERLGLGHTRLGKFLLDHWSFPGNLTEAVWLHHQPLPHFGNHSKEQLAFIVKCANNLCHIQRLGDSGCPIPDLDPEKLEDATGLSSEELAGIAAETLKRLEEISEFFNFEGCTPDLYVSAVTKANQELSRLHMNLVAKTRRIERQHSILEAICRLQSELPAAITLGGALERVVETLAEAIPNRRSMGFLLLQREGIIEGRLKLGPKGTLEKVVLPLERDKAEELAGLKPREQFSLIEQAVLRLGDGLTIAAEITQALQSANLVVLPLEASGITLGQLLVEQEPVEQAAEDTVDLLRQYARAAVLALERVFLFEAIEQQADDLARMARKGQEAQSRLYQAERLASVGRLAAGAAHEINNPLAAISAQAQLMLRRVTDKKDCKGLESIVDQSNRISKIISDLMGFARPAEPKIESTIVKSVLEHALGVLENRIKIAGIEVRKEFQPDLPLVHSDSKQLEQVFLNLMINAVQAMKGGGILTVRLQMDPARENLLIEFADTGVGIPAKELPAIFDPFYTTKKEGEGTGLGLAICHSIIEGHRGQISVSSEPGVGTTFRIMLPLSGLSDTRQLVSRLQQGLSAVPTPMKSAVGSVLIIDDEEALQAVMTESLEQEGYEVDVAVDGLDGLEKTARRDYDVTLLDLRMPRKEGMEVLPTLRKTKPRMPVIVVSGLAHDREFKAATQAGAFACLKKPFDVDELLGTVRRAIKSQKGRNPQALGGQSA